MLRDSDDQIGSNRREDRFWLFRYKKHEALVPRLIARITKTASHLDPGPPQALAGFFPGDLGALLASFGKPNRNRLLAAFDATTPSAFSRFQGSMLSPIHRTLNRFLRCFSVSGHFRSSVSLVCCHKTGPLFGLGGSFVLMLSRRRISFHPYGSRL